ncbi:MAG: class I SAM-dependent RNA methyltransferase [Magnetospiraceae bacterium]
MKKTKFKSHSLTVTVDALGARGDGLAVHNGTPLYIPFTAPGDQVAVTTEAARGDGLACRLDRITRAGPHRADPLCPHFGSCGGCAVQHLAPDFYDAWKTGLVREALQKRGFEIGLGPLRKTPVPSRRRATLAARRIAKGVILGFNARASHQIMDVDHCPLLVAPLNRVLAPLRQILALLLAPGASADIAVTAVGKTVDMVLTLPKGPDLAGREALSRFAEEAQIARLTWRHKPEDAPELLAQRAPVLADFGGAGVPLPPGGFLQPSAEGAAILTDLVCDALAGRQRIADFHAGSGTFALALLAKEDTRRVTAYEGDAGAIATLQAAARDPGRAGRLTVLKRDLTRQPPTPADLAGLDGLVFDPPRAGAKVLAEAIAASQVPVVVGVSCNPATFVRDARLLADGGYHLDKVTPVDQFPFAAHVELVAVFKRPSASP